MLPWFSSMHRVKLLTFSAQGPACCWGAVLPYPPCVLYRPLSIGCAYASGAVGCWDWSCAGVDELPPNKPPIAWPIEDPIATPLQKPKFFRRQQVSGQVRGWLLVDGQNTYAAVLAICPNSPGLCCVTAGGACVGAAAVVDIGRCCCMGPVARG